MKIIQNKLLGYVLAFKVMVKKKKAYKRTNNEIHSNTGATQTAS